MTLLALLFPRLSQVKTFDAQRELAAMSSAAERN